MYKNKMRKPSKTKQKQRSLSKSNASSRPSMISATNNRTAYDEQKKIKSKQKKKINFLYEMQNSNSNSREITKNMPRGKSGNTKAGSSSNKGKSFALSEQQKCLQGLFKKAVAKVFDVLDIFSRGTISEANINRWVPEAALYFLGSIFQKIKIKRVAMTEQQFQQQCRLIFFKSSPQDIKQFILNIQKHNNFNDQKVSLQAQQKQTIQSHVEDRFSFQVEGGQASFRKNNVAQKTLPLQVIKSSDVNFQNSEIFQKNKPSQCQQKTNERKQRQKISPLNDINQFPNLAIKSKNKKVDSHNLPLQIGKQNVKRQGLNNGGESPFFKQQAMAKTLPTKRRQLMNSDRIDKLSLRLEDYIKQNAQIIERSKYCRNQI